MCGFSFSFMSHCQCFGHLNVISAAFPSHIAVWQFVSCAPASSARPQHKLNMASCTICNDFTLHPAAKYGFQVSTNNKSPTTHRLVCNHQDSNAQPRLGSRAKCYREVSHLHRFVCQSIVTFESCSISQHPFMFCCTSSSTSMLHHRFPSLLQATHVRQVTKLLKCMGTCC